MKNHRIGAWIGQESYVDKKSGQRKTCATWTVKYPPFDRVPGDYRTKRERGFRSYENALDWWLKQKQNPHRAVAKAEVVTEAPLTLGAFLEGWLKRVRRSIGAGAFRQYESHVREHIAPSLGHVLLLELEGNAELIEEAMASWKRSDGRIGKLSPGFVKKVWATLRTALNDAKRKRKIASNPCECVDPPKVERKEMSSLSPSQVRQYLAAFDQTDIGAAIAVALGSGCRCSEVLALRWRDVDVNAGTIRVERSLERIADRTGERVSYSLNFKEPKSKRSRRTIPLTTFALERLQAYRVNQAQRFMAAGERPTPDTLVFDCDGQPWVPTSFGMHFARLRDQAGLPKVRLHDLRHSYATLLLAAGNDLKTVSTALGHSSVSITADTYTHVSPVMLRSSVDLLDALLEKHG